MKYLTFFHNCYDYTPVIIPRETDRPVFYWFGDSYHNHIPNYKYKDKYFYLFVQNPKERGVSFRSRHEGYDFHGLYAHYVEYLKERNKLRSQGLDWYCEPAIIMSFSAVKPDLIAAYHEPEKIYYIVDPVAYRGVRFNLVDNNGFPILFTQIKELTSVLPHLPDSYPFTKPPLIERTYTYEDFNKFATERDGTWL